MLAAEVNGQPSDVGRHIGEVDMDMADPATAQVIEQCHRLGEVEDLPEPGAGGTVPAAQGSTQSVEPRPRRCPQRSEVRRRDRSASVGQEHRCSRRLRDHVLGQQLLRRAGADTEPLHAGAEALQGADLAVDERV